MERLLLDIRHKGLRPGDAYLTTEAAGLMLGCSRATAHRAMTCLVETGMLVARPGSGMFIGPACEGVAPGVAQSLHAVMPIGFKPCTATPLVRLMQAVAQSQGNLGVHFNTFPSRYDFNYVAETVVKPYRAGQVAAVVALGCHWSLQQYLKEQEIKTLVIGSMFPDRAFFPSIDKDSAGGGEILVDYLIEKGHRQFGVLVPASGLAGVDLFTDAVSRRLSSHGIPADSLTLRFCNGDEPVTMDRMRELLASRRRPTAIITDEEDLANLVSNAAESLRLSVPKDLEVVFEGSLLRMSEPSVYPHTRSVLSEEDLVREVAGMIKTLPPAGGEPCARLVPVRMVENGSSPVRNISRQGRKGHQEERA